MEKIDAFLVAQFVAHQELQYKNDHILKISNNVNDVTSLMPRSILQISHLNFNLIFEPYVQMCSEPSLLNFRFSHYLRPLQFSAF